MREHLLTAGYHMYTVLPEEDQDWQAEARAWGVSESRDAICFEPPRAQQARQAGASREPGRRRRDVFKTAAMTPMHTHVLLVLLHLLYDEYVPHATRPGMTCVVRRKRAAACTQR